MLKIGIVTVVVTDQDQALKFWIEQVGFEKHIDTPAGPKARWLTVGPKGQDIQITLWNPTQWLPPEAAQAALATIGKGGSMVFNTDDCRADYAELSGRGVPFVQPPTERPYGVEAIFRDPFGNSFVLTQAHWS